MMRMRKRRSSTRPRAAGPPLGVGGEVELPEQEEEEEEQEEEEEEGSQRLRNSIACR